MAATGPPPPDPPTEPLRPSQPVRPVQPVQATPLPQPVYPVQPVQPLRPPPLVEERVVSPAIDPNVVLLRLDDAVDSLRTWLVIVGVLAVAALGVAIYGLATRDDGSRSGLASDARVTQLTGRVDRLSRQLQSVRASGGAGGAAAGLSTRVGALEHTVKTLSTQSSSGGDATQAVTQLSTRVDALSRDLNALKQSQPQTATTP